MNKHLFYKTGMAFIVGLFMVWGSTLYADTTRILELQEQLNSQGEKYLDRREALKQLEASRQLANEWYEKSLSLPDDSVERNYAVARFVNEQARILEPMIETVQELSEINERSKQTVERLIDVQAREKKSQGVRSLNRMPAATYKKVLENFTGANTLMTVMNGDPNIANQPDFAMVKMAHQKMINELRDATDNPETERDGFFKKLLAVIEARGILIDMKMDELRQNTRRLQLLGTSGASSIVTTRIMKVMGQSFGSFDDAYGQEIRQQTRELLRRTRPLASTVNDSSDGLSGNGEWLEKMRMRGVPDQ